ncbi:peptidase P60 [Cardiobacteriales bacterium ML27]|uniref:Peptidase P60 n=2 Tax=Ostreibacterium oceani TaxID=2654998 RepID=A0A6N7EVX9_9GAMM|nr:peptidase P60 [Ostreibacterium oceani]
MIKTKKTLHNLSQVVLILWLGTSLSACAVNWRGESAKQKTKAPATQAQLMAFYQSWKGTPYRLGGTGRSGIDCSAFVMQGFQQIFSIDMPRTTEAQAKVGSRVMFSERKPGDLVFFKTGWNLRHVGIYVGDNQFMHASTSKGVIISSLSNPYWEKYYWKTTRI